MAWPDDAALVKAAQMDAFGVPISYIPDAGGGDPISTSCILLQQRVSSSVSLGFFADVNVDPLVITAPQKNDQIQWADDTIYFVAQVIAPPNALPVLALHRKFDP